MSGCVSPCAITVPSSNLYSLKLHTAILFIWAISGRFGPELRRARGPSRSPYACYSLSSEDSLRAAVLGREASGTELQTRVGD